MFVVAAAVFSECDASVVVVVGGGGGGGGDHISVSCRRRPHSGQGRDLH